MDLIKKRIRKLKFETEEERLESRKKALKRANKKYRNTNPNYNAYRRRKRKQDLYNKIKEYIDNETTKSIERIINKDMTMKEMRQVFKDKFGREHYKKYIKE